jgi:acetyl/propionyl-CoA carboxylase alpha subunit
MADDLRQTAVLGVVTNQALLQAVVDHPAFRSGHLHTGFLDEHVPELPRPACPPPEAVAAAVLALARAGSHPRAAGNGRPAEAPDPWARLGPWRLGEAR